MIDHIKAWMMRVGHGWKRWLVPAAFSAAFVVQCGWFRGAKSTTYDETISMVYASQAFHHGALGLFGRLGSAPLPVLLAYWAPAVRSEPIEPPSDTWQGLAIDPRWISEARLVHSLVVGVPLILLVYTWAYRRAGPWGSLWAGGMAAFSPTILAHGALASTDMALALFGLLALAALAAHAASRSAASLAAVGLALGYALAAKYSAVVLVPIAGASLIWTLVRDVGGRPRASVLGEWLVQGAMVLAIAFLTVWGLHGFGSGPIIDQHPALAPAAAVRSESHPAELPAAQNAEPAAGRHWPLPIVGFVHQMRMAHGSQSVYLLGERSDRGWWYYFPIAFLVKSTPAELLVTATVLVLVAAGLCRPRSRRTLDHTSALWLATAACYFLACLVSSKNIGHRYLLWLYPLLALLVVDLAARRLGSRTVWLALAAVLSVSMQAASALSVRPHYLEYFNSLAGGPARGHEYLVDSSLDWGQDLPALRERLEAHGYRSVVLVYFGTAAPASYGIRGVDWKQLGDPGSSDADWLAVSATYLHGVYLPADCFAPLRRLAPADRAGYSIFLYRLDDEQVRAAFQAARVIPAKAGIQAPHRPGPRRAPG